MFTIYIIYYTEREQRMISLLVYWHWFNFHNDCIQENSSSLIFWFQRVAMSSFFLSSQLFTINQSISLSHTLMIATPIDHTTGQLKLAFSAVDRSNTWSTLLRYLMTDSELRLDWYQEGCWDHWQQLQECTVRRTKFYLMKLWWNLKAAFGCGIGDPDNNMIMTFSYGACTCMYIATLLWLHTCI